MEAEAATDLEKAVVDAEAAEAMAAVAMERWEAMADRAAAAARVAAVAVGAALGTGGRLRLGRRR